MRRRRVRGGGGIRVKAGGAVGFCGSKLRCLGAGLLGYWPAAAGASSPGLWPFTGPGHSAQRAWEEAQARPGASGRAGSGPV